MTHYSVTVLLKSWGQHSGDYYRVFFSEASYEYKFYKLLFYEINKSSANKTFRLVILREYPLRVEADIMYTYII